MALSSTCCDGVGIGSARLAQGSMRLETAFILTAERNLHRPNSVGMPSLLNVAPNRITYETYATHPVRDTFGYDCQCCQ